MKRRCMCAGLSLKEPRSFRGRFLETDAMVDKFTPKCIQLYQMCTLHPSVHTFADLYNPITLPIHTLALFLLVLHPGQTTSFW